MTEHVVWYDRNLLWYDGPQIIVARDARETLYLCVLAHTDRILGELYVAQVVNTTLLAEIECGRRDIAQVFADPMSWIIVSDNYGPGLRMAAYMVPTIAIRQDWFPDAGLVLEQDEAR